MYLYLGRISTDAAGALSVTRTEVGEIAGVAAKVGGNESPYVLLQGADVGAFVLLNTDTLVHVSVTIDVGSAYDSFPITHTVGSDFLVGTITAGVGLGDVEVLQRYSIASDGTASPLGPPMTMPQAYSSERPNDFYAHLVPQAVWDEPGVTFVARARWTDAPHYAWSYEISAFDYTYDPIWTTTLVTGPDGSMGSGAWLPNTAPPLVWVAATDTGYQVLHAAPILDPVAGIDFQGGVLANMGQSYVRRSLDVTAGIVTDPILVADTSTTTVDGPGDPGEGITPLARFDDGVTMLTVATSVPVTGG